MDLTLRPWRLPEDLPSIAQIWNTAAFEPVTPQTLAETLGNVAEGTIRHGLVGTDAGGRILGYGLVQREGFDLPGLFGIKVQVDPAHRRRGIGSALLRELEAFARERGGTRFAARLVDRDAGWVAFAERHGYAVDSHHLASKLDLEAFDEAPFAGVIARLEGEGIRFLSMADPHSPELERSLYEMVIEATHDEPGCENEPFPPFEEWRQRMFGHPHRPLDCIIVAADGEQAVGMHSMRILPVSGDASVDFTGVRRSHRGRGIALAVKLVAFRAARRHGARFHRTGSDSRNAPMLAINRKLGYQPMPGAGMYRCIKRV